MNIQLSQSDQAAMRRFFTAAKLWDRQRRERIRQEPVDPATQRAILHQLTLMARRANPGVFVDGPEEDKAESRLAHILARR